MLFWYPGLSTGSLNLIVALLIASISMPTPARVWRLTHCLNHCSATFSRIFRNLRKVVENLPKIVKNAIIRLSLPLYRRNHRKRLSKQDQVRVPSSFLINKMPFHLNSEKNSVDSLKRKFSRRRNGANFLMVSNVSGKPFLLKKKLFSSPSSLLSSRVSSPKSQEVLIKSELTLN